MEESEEIKVETATLKKFKDLAILAESDGGKIVIDILSKDIASAISMMTSNYTTLTLQEYVGAMAGIKVKAELISVFKNADINAKSTEEYIDSLKKNIEDALI